MHIYMIDAERLGPVTEGKQDCHKERCFVEAESIAGALALRPEYDLFEITNIARIGNIIAREERLPSRELKPEAYEELKRHYDACPKCGRKDRLLRVTVKWSCEACGWFEDDKGYDAVPAQGETKGRSPNIGVRREPAASGGE